MVEEVDVTEYFSSWDGWFCEVLDEEGHCCGEVIGCDTGDLQEHLKKVHNIEVKLI